MKARIYYKNQVRDVDVRDDAQRVILLRIGEQLVNMITDQGEGEEVVAVRTNDDEDRENNKS